MSDSRAKSFPVSSPARDEKRRYRNRGDRLRDRYGAEFALIERVADVCTGRWHEGPGWLVEENGVKWEVPNTYLALCVKVASGAQEASRV